MKKNINKQEEVVSILWAFAHDLQTSTKLHTTCTSDGTKMDLDAIEKAITAILAVFNLEVTEVQ